jgi:hypothetical protein
VGHLLVPHPTGWNGSDQLLRAVIVRVAR